MALYALRVQRLAGSRCMNALCDLLVEHQIPGSAAQACVNLIKSISSFLTHVDLLKPGLCCDPTCTLRRNRGCSTSNQLVLCSECSARLLVLSAFVWAAVASRGSHERNRRPLPGCRHLTT